MTGVRLILKVRRSASLLAVLLAVAVIARAIGSRGFLVGDQTPVPLPWAAVLPVICAYAVASSAESPMPLAEHQAARRMAMVQLTYLFAAALVAAALIAWATAPLTGTVTMIGALRNYLGLLGLSLLGIALLGVGLGWAVPLACVGVGVIAGGLPVHPVVIDWLIRQDRDLAAAGFAASLLVAGAIAFLAPARTRQRATRTGASPEATG